MECRRRPSSLVSGSGHDTVDGGAGDDMLSLAGRDAADATIGTNNGVTTISFADGFTVDVQSVETVVFDDQALKI